MLRLAIRAITCPFAAVRCRSVADGTGARLPDRGWSRPPLLVSACLLGVRCTHDAGHEDRAAVRALASTHRLLPVCPETAGGLPTPRPAAERTADGRVRTESGADVTDAYERGAAHAVALAAASGATAAVLKARSPSCGCHQVYDGTFTRTRVDGEGVAAQALRRAGLEVVDEADVAAGWSGVSRPVPGA
jgi:uncharacterized protein YbbK (DUF523 family)